MGRARKTAALSAALALLSAAAFAQQDAPPTGPQVDFHAVIERALSIYVPYMAAQGVVLRFVEGHEHMITGSGHRDDAHHATLSVDDGYYSNPKITEDGFRFMVCHELGHITGSAPHMEAPAMYDGLFDEKGDIPISAEGQADYFAAAKCMRQLLAGQDDVSYVRVHGVPAAVAARCGQSFQDEEESALCQRIMVAGKNFLDSFARSFPSSFEAQDPARPPYSMLGEHPPAQCRLDTVAAGALCPVGKDAPVDLYDPSVGFCTSKNFPLGARPRCWFKE